MRSLPVYVRVLLLTVLILTIVPMDMKPSAASGHATRFAQNPSLALAAPDTPPVGLNRKVMLPVTMRVVPTPPPGAAPMAPSALSALGASQTSIRLTWQDNANNESGFQIERTPVGVSNWASVGATLADQSSYLDQNLTPSTAYTYRVRATGATGASAYCAPATGSTLALPSTRPASPTNLQASNTTDSSTYLTWQDNANNETGFRVERLLYPGDFVEIGRLGENVTAVQVIDLPAGASVRFRITAYNAVGISDPPSDGSNVRLVNTASAYGTALRFQNNTSHPIIYLTVDGQQQFPRSPLGILSGNYYEAPVAAGIHTYEVRNGFWQDNGVPFYMYTWRGTVSITSGTQQLNFSDPTIQQIMTDFKANARWSGSFWAGNPIWIHDAAFCFYTNGKFRYYEDGYQKATGTYGNYQKGSLYDTFVATYAGGPAYQAMLYEQFGQFDMSNGPAGWTQIQYTREVGVTCSAPAP
jgi:hypothetical protein